jgi:hypothetical protein
MGLRLRGAIRCGACGRPRGITHTCVTSGSRRRGRTHMQNPVTWECATCRKPRGLRHTCVIRTDFKARKRKAATAERRRKRKAVKDRQAARRKQAAAERRARARARKQTAKTRPRPPRPRGDSHEPGTCGDRDCPRYGCKAYYQGMADCPGPHDGG